MATAAKQSMPSKQRLLSCYQEGTESLKSLFIWEPLLGLIGVAHQYEKTRFFFIHDNYQYVSARENDTGVVLHALRGGPGS